MSQTDQMLCGGEHTGLVIDTDACVKTGRGGSIDTDDRHMDPLELLDFLRLDGERCHEHGVDVTAYRQLVKKSRRFSAVSMCWNKEMS